MNKKKSSCEESNLKSNIIIALNAQTSNDIKYFFNREVLKMATAKELKKLSYLAAEIPYKWCSDNVNFEFKRRAI